MCWRTGPRQPQTHGGGQAAASSNSVFIVAHLARPPNSVAACASLFDAYPLFSAFVTNVTPSSQKKPPRPCRDVVTHGAERVTRTRDGMADEHRQPARAAGTLRPTTNQNYGLSLRI